MLRTKPYPISKAAWLIYFKNNSYAGRLLVNHLGGPQLKDHAVLRKMIRRGIFKVERQGSLSCRRTFLILNEK